MYRSSPFRSTLNTGYITCLDTCKVCTEAVHSVALWTRVSTCFRFKYVQKQAMRSKMQKKGVQEPKLREAKRARKRVRGAFQGRRTSRFAGIYIYIPCLFRDPTHLPLSSSLRYCRNPSYETWRFKCNPKFPKPEHVRTEAFQGGDEKAFLFLPVSGKCSI